MSCFDTLRPYTLPGPTSASNRCTEFREEPFDEPFAAGIDPPGLRKMRSLIQRSVETGRTLVYTTQLVKYALDFSTRVLVIEDTVIYFDGSPERFREKLEAGDPVLAEFSDDEVSES